MAAVQRFVLYLIGFVYLLRTVLQLTWNFITHPRMCLKTTNLKSPTVAPSCITGDSYGNHQFITRNGTKLHCVVHGPDDKPLIVFIHGFPDFWYAWRHQIAEFSQTYRTVAIDLRGFGDSDKPTDISAYSSSNLRDDIVSVVHALNYQTCILVAHDIGGSVAFHVVSKYPEVVQKLIVINCPHPAVFRSTLKTNKLQKQMSWYMFMFQLPYIPEILCRVFDYKLIRDNCDGHFGSARSRTDHSAYRFMYSRNGFRGQINFYRAALSTTQTVTSEIKTPTLLIWGEGDHVLLKEMAEMTKQYIPDVEVKFVSNAGHWPHIDEATDINIKVKDFLDQQQ